MKRIGNVYNEIGSVGNLIRAEERARKGKENTRGVRAFDRVVIRNGKTYGPIDKLIDLHQQLMLGEYKTSPYHTFQVQDPKERKIYELPYYPDRIVHCAVLMVIGDRLFFALPPNTYSSIPDRGGMKLHDRMERILRQDRDGTRYCLCIDVKKYFPSIQHDNMKMILRRFIKDRRLLELLDELIDSCDGMPIGNWTSQTFANLYFYEMDHHYSGEYYFRYTDNVWLFGCSKEWLHEEKDLIDTYLHYMGVEMKDNWQIFPVDSRGVDAVGFRFYHGYTLLRKRIKKHIIEAKRRVQAGADRDRTLGGYLGWMYASNTKHFNLKYNIVW